MEDIAELLCMMGIAVCGIPLFLLYVVPIILPLNMTGCLHFLWFVNRHRCNTGEPQCQQ